MVFFQLNVTGLLFQSFRTASPICKYTSILILCISILFALSGCEKQDAAALYEAAVEANMQQWGVELPAGEAVRKL